LEGSSCSILAEIEGDGTNEDTSKRSIAKKFLLKTRGNGPVPAKELLAHAKEGLGISHDTLRRAQEKLRIVPRKLSMSGGGSWSLPSSQFLR
jgi:hypothetical protein